MKKKLILPLATILLLTLFFFITYDTDRLIPDNPKGKIYYYTNLIDQSYQLKNNRYEYTLSCINASGEKRNCTFTTSKKLKENSFLKLYYARFRGVTFWEQINYVDLPLKVQNLIKVNK